MLSFQSFLVSLIVATSRMTELDIIKEAMPPATRTFKLAEKFHFHYQNVMHEQKFIQSLALQSRVNVEMTGVAYCCILFAYIKATRYTLYRHTFAS